MSSPPVAFTTSYLRLSWFFNMFANVFRNGFIYCNFSCRDFFTIPLLYNLACFSIIFLSFLLYYFTSEENVDIPNDLIFSFFIVLAFHALGYMPASFPNC